MTNPVGRVFRNMDAWRHLPAYQLERRADIFFSAYLPEAVAKHTGVPVSEQVIPELPILRSLIWPESRGSSSVKVDYAVFAADRSRVFFVELKTDGASRRDSQDTYLSKSCEIGFGRIVEGIVQISQATNAYQKYGHLLKVLEGHGCVQLPDALTDHLWPEVKPGLGRLLKEVTATVPADAFQVEVIYLQPQRHSDAEDVIDFDEFAALVEGYDDEVSTQFAASLRKWKADAGTAPPATL